MSILSFIYSLGCLAVVILFVTTVKNTVVDEGKFELTLGAALHVVCLILCSWIGFVKLILTACKEKKWYQTSILRITYTKDGDDENKTDVHSDAD